MKRLPMKLHPHFSRTQRKRQVKPLSITIIQPARKDRVRSVSLDGLRVVEECNRPVAPWWATASREGFTDEAARRFAAQESKPTNYRLLQDGID